MELKRVDKMKLDSHEKLGTHFVHFKEASVIFHAGNKLQLARTRMFLNFRKDSILNGAIYSLRLVFSTRFLLTLALH